MSINKAGTSYDVSQKKWLDFLEARRRKSSLPKILPLPKNPVLPAYKLTLTHKASFRPLEDLIYAVEEDPRLCIHGLKGVKINTENGKMRVIVQCRENITKRKDTDLKVQDLTMMDIYWPCLNKKFVRKELFWQYQVDKYSYSGLTEIKGDYLNFGLGLGLKYIPRILEVFTEHGYTGDKSYRCLELVERFEKGLEFTPEVVFGKMETSNQLLYLDSVSVFVRRDDLKPINYLIDRPFLKNKWFRLENLGTRLGYSRTEKKAKISLEFN